MLLGRSREDIAIWFYYSDCDHGFKNLVETGGGGGGGGGGRWWEKIGGLAKLTLVSEGWS